MKFISNKGGGSSVDIETAILNGYAPDGGLYVPEELPQISVEQLEQWKNLPYKELAFELLSLFIDRSIVSAHDLKSIIGKAYGTFEKEEVIPISKLKSQKNTLQREHLASQSILSSVRLSLMKACKSYRF